MILYEHFNTTNKSAPYYQAHQSFVTNIRVQECARVHETPFEDQCSFVQDTLDCRSSVQYLDYMNFLYCVVSSSNDLINYLSVGLLVLLCVYMFTILGTTADRFFCPALAVLSDVMGLSENLAGVTILAFGNGSPDIFTALADFGGDTELMYAELMGAATFIIGVVAASIIIIQPFSVNSTTFMRDIVFFMAACVWITYAFRNERFTYVEANGTIAIYLLYLAVVISDHVIVKSKLKAPITEKLKNLSEENTFRVMINSKEVLTDKNATATPRLSDNANDMLWQNFIQALNPIDIDDWNDAGWFGKSICVAKAPINLILIIIIPCVDYTIDVHGWNKLLNTLQVVCMPLAVMLMKKWILLNIWGIPVLASIPFFGAAAVAVFRTSRTDRPPKYHLLFAIFGSFVGSIMVISCVATEVVSVLSTIGIVSKLSQSMLGLSMLAWGNSIGDLISNITLARKGYAKMGFAACFGGPMFNTLLGIGVVFNLKIYYSDHQEAFGREGIMGPNCTYFLLMLLFFTLLMFAFNGFQARRSVGIFMVGVYALFIVFSMLGEFEVQHPYGTDHRNEGDFEN